MTDYRKLACELSGELFKEVHKKGVRREKLASELGVSVNQIKNYAYDTSKSATLENFIHTMLEHNCRETLAHLAQDMGYSLYRLPDAGRKIEKTQAVCEAMRQVSQAFSLALAGDKDADSEILKAIEKLLGIRTLQ